MLSYLIVCALLNGKCVKCFIFFNDLVTFIAKNSRFLLQSKNDFFSRCFNVSFNHIQHQWHDFKWFWFYFSVIFIYFGCDKLNSNKSSCGKKICSTLFVREWRQLARINIFLHFFRVCLRIFCIFWSKWKFFDRKSNPVYCTAKHILHSLNVLTLKQKQFKDNRQLVVPMVTIRSGVFVEEVAHVSLTSGSSKM